MNEPLFFTHNSNIHKSRIYIIISVVLFFIFINCPLFEVTTNYQISVLSKYTPLFFKFVAILIPIISVITRYNTKLIKYIFYINMAYFIDILAIPIITYSHLVDKFNLHYKVDISTTILCISFLSIIFLILATVQEDKDIKNFSILINELIESGNNGNVQSQLQLGEIYSRGIGLCLPKNYKKAMEWYSKAANQGNSIAQNNLKRIKT